MDYIQKTVNILTPFYESVDPELTTEREKGHLRTTAVCIQFF